MDFGFTEEQDLLRQSAADFLNNECPMSYVRQMMEDERGYADELWQKMAELGWMGLIFPERYGGSGLSLIDMVVVLEEMGRVVLPGPFFSTVVLGGFAILEAGSEEQKNTLLPHIASGQLKTTLAVLEDNARWDEQGVRLRAEKNDGGYQLSGVKLFVPDAHVADTIVCAARTAEGFGLFLIDRQQAGVSTSVLKTMDQTRKLCELRLDKVQLSADALLGPPGLAWDRLSRVLDRSKVALCAEMAGGAQRVLDMSVEYAKIREQFGRPIGSFQAIQHKCADMFSPGRKRQVCHLLRGLGGLERRARCGSGVRYGQSVLQRCVSQGQCRRDSGPRRHRFYLGARHAHLFQAGQGLRSHLWRCDLE